MLNLNNFFNKYICFSSNGIKLTYKQMGMQLEGILALKHYEDIGEFDKAHAT